MDNEWFVISTEAIEHAKNVVERYETFVHCEKKPHTYGPNFTLKKFINKLPFNLFSYGKLCNVKLLNGYCKGEPLFNHDQQGKICAVFCQNNAKITIRIVKIWTKSEVLAFLKVLSTKIVLRETNDETATLIVKALKGRSTSYQHKFTSYLKLLQFLVENIPVFGHVDVTRSIFMIMAYAKHFKASSQMLEKIEEELKNIYTTLSKLKGFDTIMKLENDSLDIILQKRIFVAKVYKTANTVFGAVVSIMFLAIWIMIFLERWNSS